MARKKERNESRHRLETFPECAGDGLRHMRETAGLSKADLAEMAGTYRSQLAKWERGSAEPRLSNLAQIAMHCGYRVRLVLEPVEDAGYADGDGYLD